VYRRVAAIRTAHPSSLGEDTGALMTIGRIAGVAALGAMACAALAILWHLSVSLLDGALLEYWRPLMKGVWITVVITVATFTIGALMSLPIAMASRSPLRWLRRGADGYMALFRYSPLIAQLYLVYYGAGQISPQLKAVGLWWLFEAPLSCVLLVFTLNTSAYQAYVVKGAIAALPHEQNEAALALGLGKWVTFFKVLLPQALLVAIRPLGNELTMMIKASSIASTVTVFDLLASSKLIYNDILNFDIYVIAAVIYVAAVEGTRMGVSRLSLYLTRHQRQAAAGPLPEARLVIRHARESSR
jgi:polar amino acid transport system permease protein